MAISAVGMDGLAQHHQTVVTPAAPARHPGVRGPGEHGRTGADRNDSQKQDRRSGSFRALLDGEAVTESTERIASPSAKRSNAADGALARADKLPTAAAVELSGDETAALMSAATPAEMMETLARKLGADMAAQGQSFISPASRDFLDAASRYAERLTMASGAYARPGESLEITA